MVILVRVKEGPNGFTYSASGKIERTEQIIQQFEDFQGSNGPRDYDFTGQKRHNDTSENLSTALSLWMNRPTYKLKVLSVADMEVSVRRSPVTIKSQVFENLDYYKEESYDVRLEKKVSNSVESSWSNVKPFFKGEIIDYEIETLDSSSFYYSQRWGESTDRSKSRLLKLPSMSYPIAHIKPLKSVNVELNAIKTTITVRIKYRCDYDGDISYTYETIRAEFYTDPRIDF